MVRMSLILCIPAYTHGANDSQVNRIKMNYIMTLGLLIFENYGIFDSVENM